MRQASQNEVKQDRGDSRFQAYVEQLGLFRRRQFGIKNRKGSRTYKIMNVRRGPQRKLTLATIKSALDKKMDDRCVFSSRTNKKNSAITRPSKL